MLKLKLVTDPRWVRIAENNLEEILRDHAFCEQKAASNAISLIINFPEYPDLVREMSDLAIEEMEHFKRVHQIIVERGFELGRERKDEYVNDLYAFIRKGTDRKTLLCDRLLFAAMVEARSCERFRLLSEQLSDKTLASFYRELMISEANHYTLFIKLAKQYNDPDLVDKRWKEFLDYEGKIILEYGRKETIHG